MHLVHQTTENLEALDVESKAWTVSVEPSDGNLQAPLENLQAPN